MSDVAQKAGIGRATLYKHFADVHSVLRAWHDREIHHHLARVSEAADHAGRGPGDQLRAALTEYALIAHESRGGHDAQLAQLLHGDEQVNRASHELRSRLADLIARAQQASDVRSDVPAQELATFCAHALAAASQLPSKAAVERLVAITWSGLEAGHLSGGRTPND
jgi:AcrR family transcriptional regulator